MEDLVTWLRAQLDDDESRFHDGLGGPCEAKGLHLWPDRARVEVDAKRRILDRWADLRSDVADALNRDESDEAPVVTEFAYEQVCKTLALPYADRDGYREEWRP